MNNKQLTEITYTRLKPEEKALVKQLAEQANMSISAFVRFCVLQVILKK